MSPLLLLQLKREFASFVAQQRREGQTFSEWRENTKIIHHNTANERAESERRGWCWGKPPACSPPPTSLTHSSFISLSSAWSVCMCVCLSVCDYMCLDKHACIYRHTGEILMVAHVRVCVCAPSTFVFGSYFGMSCMLACRKMAFIMSNLSMATKTERQTCSDSERELPHGSLWTH